MSEQTTRQRRRRPSLAVRVSAWLMVAAIAPLIITVLCSELLARPALIAQANTTMQSDAKTRVQLIDTYFQERLLDAATLSQVPTVQEFLATGQAQTNAGYALAAGIYRDKNYMTWALFDPKGNIRLYYPLTNPPQPHGHYLVPPEDLQAVTAGKSFISPVYYNPKTQKASVDIYQPVASPAHVLLGFMRASLNIDYIWGIVGDDYGAKGPNGSGSYAFILDQNGVRIADTNAQRLFSAVSPLSTEQQQMISSEARYGTSAPVPVLADSALATMQTGNTSSSTGQFTPAGAGEPFEVSRQQLNTAIVPWTYYVLSPNSTVTAVANQQLLYISLIAFGVLLLAALFGLWAGRRITRPILQSVENLRGNSYALNALSTKQKSAATEQMWVVDSSQVGLQSVQYYTEASKVAAQQLGDIGTELARRWHQLDVNTAKAALSQMITTAQYIEKAAQYQSDSNQKLATAIKVTTQVSEQLATGATSAANAATQLEQVVNQLRDVVGK